MNTNASLEAFDGNTLMKLRDIPFWWFHDDDGRMGLVMTLMQGDDGGGIQLVLTADDILGALPE